jgi:hypothetical protein
MHEKVGYCQVIRFVEYAVELVGQLLTGDLADGRGGVILFGQTELEEERASRGVTSAFAGERSTTLAITILGCGKVTKMTNKNGIRD